MIIKDTAPEWEFLYYLSDNIIHSNTTAGLKLHYGNYSLIWGNEIYDNPVGIHLEDTWHNTFLDNMVHDNDIDIKIERDKWYVGGNTFFRNDFGPNPVIWDNTDCDENHWHKRKSIGEYEENTCIGTVDVTQSNCPADYYCHPGH